MDEVTSMGQLERIDQPFGPRLKVARELAGMSREQLARRIGVETASIEAWEADARAPRANRVMTLSGVLGVTIGWLLEGREDGYMSTGQTPSLEGLRAQIDSVRLALNEAGEVLRNIDESLQTLVEDDASEPPSAPNG
jgi:HTH-type transcriptional regulator, cell division transcriptional repressor